MFSKRGAESDGVYVGIEVKNAMRNVEDLVIKTNKDDIR
jgi:hypothetical protein